MPLLLTDLSIHTVGCFPLFTVPPLARLRAGNQAAAAAASGDELCPCGSCATVDRVPCLPMLQHEQSLVQLNVDITIMLEDTNDTAHTCWQPAYQGKCM